MSTQSTLQFSTFYIADRLYGIEVEKVQEVTKSMPITPIPTAPNFIHGFINLRGQIATAISLRNLFALEAGVSTDQMNVVCRDESLLVSLLVDEIGDVVEVQKNWFEETPDTINSEISDYMSGVYKTPDKIMSVLNVKKIINILNEN